MANANRGRLWRPRLSLRKQLSFRYSNQYCMREARRVSRSVIDF